jgi:hypothetical protein
MQDVNTEDDKRIVAAHGYEYYSAIKNFVISIEKACAKSAGFFYNYKGLFI